MKLGRYSVDPVLDGPLRLDGGAMFGIVPRILWQKRLPPDEQHRVPLALRCLLLREAGPGGRVILVDTGMGMKWTGREAGFYGRDEPEPGLDESLTGHGLTRDDVTDVVLTHLHFDHAGGATRLNERGELVPSFARARYYVQRRNLDWARGPTERDAGSYRSENFEPLLEHGVLELIDGPGELFPGVHLVLSEGHTCAQQLILLDGDAGGGLLYATDIIPTSHHLNPAWVMAYDLHPGVTSVEKTRLLEMARDRNLWLMFEHDPTLAAARVRRGARDWELTETWPVTPGAAVE